ncbi:MAG TPA: hypothetical protein VHC97_23120 [Thermoanaerobaculia bacterium]|jgi:hypothetical protein|nr:hypothetical protein [Thermoanaerobaculia bacterium]
MLDSLSSPAGGAVTFAQAKKARRLQKAERPVAAETAAARPERIPPLAKLLLACAAVLGLLIWTRLSAPQPWSYDEYYHLGLARVMRSDFRIDSFWWTPFSILYDRFVDSGPLFHILLMPFATLPLETAGFLGVLLGQVFLVGSFAWVLWTLRVPRPWWFVLALPALGPMFALRLEMCRPQVWLMGFTVLVIGLLLTRRWKTLFVVSALFGLTHTAGWIAIALAALWAVSGLAAAPGEPDRRRILWQPVAAAAGGWLLGQLVHPEVPANFRLFWLSNFVIPFQATSAGDAALRSQLGTELSAPEFAILVEQWPAFIAPVIVLVSLVFQPRLRSRATLTAGIVSIAFLLAGSLVIRRFFELAAPLALLALAIVLRERREQALPPLLPGWGRWLAAAAILLGGLETFGALQAYGFGRTSAPREMARWLGEHGEKGERVFTAQWADSAPLFYAAPQLQSLVALDPTAFYAKDPALFQAYVNIVQGNHPDPARAIRERFGARYVTLWKMPTFQAFARQLGLAPGVSVAYGDNEYLVVDLGKPQAPQGSR